MAAHFENLVDERVQKPDSLPKFGSHPAPDKSRLQATPPWQEWTETAILITSLVKFSLWPISTASLTPI